MAKGRIDTGALFAGMIGKDEQGDTDNKKTPVIEKVVVMENQEPATPTKVGRKPKKEKNIQVSIYLTPDQAKKLRLQDAEKEKETDKSAIARTGIDIALSLSNKEYVALKVTAQQQGKTAGQIVKEALAKYL